MTLVLAHAHSTWSHDGVLALSAWPAVAHSIGCEVVLLSEHEETGWDASRYREYVAACGEASQAGVQLVPGLEFNQDGFHVLCYGLQTLPDRPSSATALAAAVHAQGCLLCLAHPGKYGWRYPPDLLAAADAVEVWNSKWIYDGTSGPHPESLRLAAGKQFLVGQDVHQRKHVTDLLLETDTPRVLDALRDNCYRFAQGDRRWSPQEFAFKPWAGWGRRVRTGVLRRALAAYRWSRPWRRALRVTGHFIRPLPDTLRAADKTTSSL